MEIIIIRHAETKGNLERRYIGLTDEPICENGKAHAEAFGSYPDVKRVVVSPLLRARQTAAIIFPNAELVPYEGLEEMHFGDFEGKRFEEMANDPKYQAWVDNGGVDNCPNGESRAEFIARTCEAFKKVLNDASAKGEERLFIVAHCGTLMAVTSSFADPPCDYFDCRVSHCEGFRFALQMLSDGSIRLTDRILIKDLKTC
jgi:alpha-ribazole phosphatase